MPAHQPMKVATCACWLLLAAAPSAAIIAPDGRITATTSIRERRPHQLTPALQLRGGNVLNIVRERATRVLKERARRDDHRTVVCAARAVFGIWLLFQPAKHWGVTEEPVGRAVMQLFFSAHFYLRLVWLLMTKSDFFDVPRSRDGKLRKRGVSALILLQSLLIAQWAGWAHTEQPMVMRALPSGMALGVVTARTCTAVFDYTDSTIRETMRLVNAKRKILQNKKKIEKQIQFETDKEARAELKAVMEAAAAAQRAVEKTLQARSKAQEAARRAAAKRVSVQLIRTAIAVCTTTISMRCATDGHFPLEKSVLRRLHVAKPPSPENIALYAPCVVGAFELAQSFREICHINEFLISRVKISLFSLAIKSINPVIAFARLLAKGVQRAWNAITDYERRLEVRFFGDEHYLLHYFEARADSVSSAVSTVREAVSNVHVGNASVGKGLASLVDPTVEAAKQVGKLGVKAFHWLQGYRKWLQWGALARRLIQRSRFIRLCVCAQPPRVCLLSLCARSLAVQKQIKKFIKDTQYDLWPWALAIAGFKVQCGELKLRGVPGYLGKIGAAPVRAVAKLSSASFRLALRLVQVVVSRPALRFARAIGRGVHGVATGRGQASAEAAAALTAAAAADVAAEAGKEVVDVVWEEANAILSGLFELVDGK